MMIKADDIDLGLLTSKALTLMLEGRVEEMRVRRPARKHVRAFLGLSLPEQQRVLAGSNVFVFCGSPEEFGQEEDCEEEVANCLDHSACDVASEVDWSRDSDNEVETDAGAEIIDEAEEEEYKPIGLSAYRPPPFKRLRTKADMVPLEVQALCPRLHSLRANMEVKKIPPKKHVAPWEFFRCFLFVFFLF